MMKNNKLYDSLVRDEEKNGTVRLTLAQYVRQFTDKGQEITVIGHGESMLPIIDENCELLMAPVSHYKIRRGDIVLFERSNGKSVIHRVWNRSEDSFDMIGDNQISIERNVPYHSIVAYVKAVTDDTGRNIPSHCSVIQMRTRRMYKQLRNMLGVIKRLFLQRPNRI